MALDREKTFRNAERLLGQGKVQPALAEFRRLADESPRDLVMLNRVGDLLARLGRNEEAIGYYRRIADQFTNAGFFPKAIAILKKVLRLDPASPDAFAALGDLYLKQKLAGEAKRSYLHSADLYVRKREFSKARSIYEKLVAAEPRDPIHRVRLAEARAAEGDSERAGEDLLAVATTLESGGEHSEAERAFRRAAELLPERADPVCGIGRSLAAQERRDEAIALLERAIEQPTTAAGVCLDLAMLYEQAGRGKDAADLLERNATVGLDERAAVRYLSWFAERNREGEFWTRFDRVVEKIRVDGGTGRAEALLTALAGTEDPGHLPAVQRLVDLLRSESRRAEAGDAVERLVRTLEAKGMEAEARDRMRLLRELKPDSPLLGRASQETAEDEPHPPPGEDDEPGAPKVPIEAEAPAVPLNQADHEFVSGHLTEAEVFQKYGLVDEAIKQLREVTARFPGHVEAQERLADALRARGERVALGEVMARLAFARRAGGDVEGARTAASEALAADGLGPVLRASLAALGLIEAAGVRVAREDQAETGEIEDDGAIEPDFQAEEAETVAMPRPAPPSPPPASASPDASAAVDEGEEELEIVFDDDDSAVVDAPEPVAAAPEATVEPAPPPARAGETEAGADGESTAEVPAVKTKTKTKTRTKTKTKTKTGTKPRTGPAGRAAPAELLEEIAFFIDQGMLAEAGSKLEALRTLGFDGPDVQAVADRLGEVREAVSKGGDDLALELDGDAQAGDEAGFSDRLDEEDLGSITAALEAELGAAASKPAIPETFGEQSLAEVFDAFKRHVQEEIGDEDFRTHYDLGIAYKEMGLLDDALAAFRLAAGSAELRREAVTMIAICHRERGETVDAVRHYREALAVPGANVEATRGLRYDLAEALSDLGEDDEALALFEEIRSDDPEYRDVAERVQQLQSRSR